MMRQYCRYCAHLYTGNGIWCGEHQKEMSESAAKRVNNCKDFSFNEIDAFYENPNPYRPRGEYKARIQAEESVEQMRLEG